MMEQVLSPGVQNARRIRPAGAQMFGIGGNGKEGLRSGAEQDAVNHFTCYRKRFRL